MNEAFYNIVSPEGFIYDKSNSNLYEKCYYDTLTEQYRTLQGYKLNIGINYIYDGECIAFCSLNKEDVIKWMNGAQSMLHLYKHLTNRSPILKDFLPKEYLEDFNPRFSMKNIYPIKPPPSASAEIKDLWQDRIDVLKLLNESWFLRLRRRLTGRPGWVYDWMLGNYLNGTHYYKYSKYL